MTADLFPDLAARVISAVKTAAPDLRTCKARAGALTAKELDDLGAASPAVIVSWLGARPAAQRTGPQPSFDLGMAAYVITKDRLGLDRETAAAALSALLMTLIPDRTWGRAEAGEATNVRLESLVTDAVRNAGIALWAVTWSQPVALAVEDIEGELPRQFYAPEDPIEGGPPYELVSEVAP